MKRITLTVLLVGAAVGTVLAQTPPARPVEPARPTPAPMPMGPVARPLIATPISPLDMDEMRVRIEDMRLDRLDLETTRRAMDVVRAHQVEINEAAREASRLALEDARIAREDGLRAREEALVASRVSVNAMVDVPFAELPPMRALAPMPALAPMARVSMSDALRLPAPQWFQGDPADSAYRYAYDVLSRGDYGRAAQLFREIGQKYPKSSYQNDLPYWEAYSRYKIGSTDELHNAVKLLEPRAGKLIGTTGGATATPREGFYAYGRRGTSDADFVTLYVRVNSVLAQRGDRGAADVVARAAQAGVNTCDREDMNVRAEALGTLATMDPAGALPRIKGVLEKKDECSVELRRRAVFILGRRGDAEAATLLGVTAKSDPSVSVRSDAITWLPRLQGDAGVAVLEDLLRSDQDENIQRSVVRTLVASDNAKARTSMRTLIERKDAPLSLRIEAINSYNNDRATADDAAYLRSLYSRADNDRIKEAIVGALGRIGGPDNDAFVLGIVKNTNEPSQVRSQAIARLMRKDVSIVDLGKLYDASESRNIRQQIVSQLDRRTETDAADKLFDIAKNSTDNTIKMQAFQALLRRKDERTKQLLSDYIDGKRP